MANHIINAIHLMLMQEVDGPAADRFNQHISTARALERGRYSTLTLAQQLNWMAIYWIQQMATINHEVGYRQENTLLLCETEAEFLRVFWATVLPYIHENDAIPNINLPITPLGVYSNVR